MKKAVNLREIDDLQGKEKIETLVVEMTVKNATKKELKILSNFSEAIVTASGKDCLNISYKIYFEYLNSLKSRLEAVIELMGKQKNKITVSAVTKLQVQALTIYKLCDGLLAAKQRREMIDKSEGND